MIISVDETVLFLPGTGYPYEPRITMPEPL
jgi:hypothetical protein